MDCKRQTKIIATLGPAQCYNSSDDAAPELIGKPCYEKIRDLYLAGANFFRLNFSHGTHEQHGEFYSNIHRLREELGVDIGVLADLSGPKLRILTFESGSIQLEPGQRLKFDQDRTPGNQSRVCLPQPRIIEALQPGHKILLDDGNVRMVVEEKGGNGNDAYFVASVLSGSKLSNNKGVNVPDTVVDIPALTEKDRADMEFALNLGVDWIALSFVQKAEDVIWANELIADRAKLVAKIETRAALQNFAEIMAEADGVMVARGDLGVELPFYEVPIIQRYIIDYARRAGKPAIVATQMAESMILNPSPTRAEASDISTAVAQGASATMLSAESASGKYPLEAVDAMARIIQEREEFRRDPQGYISKIFNEAIIVEDSSPLPPPVPLITWQERRMMGEEVLRHLHRIMAQDKLTPAT